jgi:hypothetical protein
VIALLGFAVGTAFVYSGKLRSDQRLTVHDINGSIRLRLGDRLAIHARKTANRGDPNAVVVKVEPRPDGLIVCVRYPPNTAVKCGDAPDRHDSSNNDTQVNFDVTVPRGVAVDMRTVNGSIDAQADGILDAMTVNGSLSVIGPAVRLVHGVNSAIVVRLTGKPQEDVDLSTITGSIDLTIPSSIGYTLRAHTVTGSINADAMTAQKSDFGPGTTLNGSLGDGSLRIELESVTGGITVRRR